MPVAAAPANPVPQYWTLFGHSYFQLSFGTRTQQGRGDGFMRSLLYTQQGLNVQNHCAAGVRFGTQGDNGFGRILQVVRGGAQVATQNSPYVIGGWGGSGGAYLLGYGINDVGFNGNTNQNCVAYQNCMRTALSRLRMSTMGSLNNIAGMNQGGCGSFAQTGFGTTAASGYSTSGNLLFQLATTGGTLTITLPADYNGETVACLFIGSPSNSPGINNVWTISGTAGLTGTFNTDNLQPATSLNNTPFILRFKTLTAANAGQTIKFTTTTLGASTIFLFDSWWLEADAPPPVIVCNTARLCDNPFNLFPTIGNSGYTVYAVNLTPTTTLSGTNVSATPATIGINSTLGLPAAGKATILSSGGTVTISWTGQSNTLGGPYQLTGCTAAGGSGTYSTNILAYAGPTDTDVASFNTFLTSVVGEFDSMVQIADIDSALNKSNANFCFDGLHPNELGASQMGRAILAAVQRLTPTSPASAANLNPPAPVITPLSRPYLNAQWYTSDTFGGATGSAYTPVAGDVWALPFFITSGVSLWTQWSMIEATATVAPTVFMAIFDDRQMSGYPNWMCLQPANGSALSLLAAPGTFTSTTTPGNNGYLNQQMDPGLYWFCVKFVTTGTCTFTTLKGPSLWVPNLTSAGGAPAGSPCAWKLTGQPTTAFSGRFASGATPTDNAPVIGVKVLVAQ